METKCCYGRFRDLFQLLKKLWFVYFYLIEIFPYKTKFCLRSSQCAPLWFFLFFLSFHLLLGNEILCKKVEKCIQGLKKVNQGKAIYQILHGAFENFTYVHPNSFWQFPLGIFLCFYICFIFSYWCCFLKLNLQDGGVLSLTFWRLEMTLICINCFYKNAGVHFVPFYFRNIHLLI